MTDRARWGIGASLVLIACVLVPARASTAPRGIHVAFGADPQRQATIIWFTDGMPDGEPEVRFGSAAAALTESVRAVTALVPGEYPTGTVAAHEAVLTDLAPGEEVFYRVGNDTIWSATASFTTAPADDGTFTFTAFGDHGVKDRSVTTTNAVIAEDPAFHLIAGDLSYAYHGDGSFPTWTDWDTWFTQLEPLASRTPVMPALGNHEMESVGGTGSFRARFALPGDELTYSFDYRNVHVLVFNSDRNAALEEAHLPAQLTFAAQDLADAAARRDAGEIDFIVVVQHHPLYGISDSSLESELLERQYNPYLIATEEPLLHRFGVDVLITAHNHSYARSFPMRFGNPTSTDPATYEAGEGLIQVTTGGGGQSLHTLVAEGSRPAWTAAGAARFHFTSFTVDGSKMTVRAIATDVHPPDVLDTFTITRSGP